MGSRVLVVSGTKNDVLSEVQARRLADVLLCGELVRVPGIVPRADPRRTGGAGSARPIHWQWSLEFGNGSCLHFLDQPPSIDARQDVIGICVGGNLACRLGHPRHSKYRCARSPSTVYRMRNAGV